MKLPSIANFRLEINPGVPGYFHRTFNFLYSDIFAFGILNGSILTFINVYAARIGASGTQIGILNAIPAVIAIIFAIPSGAWLTKGDAHLKVVLSSFWHRIFYLLLIFIPFLASQSLQIILIMAVTLVMSFPGTLLQVGFNHLFADVVPPEWRSHVAGIRNAGYAIISVCIILACGELLSRLAFPGNYQFVFTIGFIGAMLSSFFLVMTRNSHRAAIQSGFVKPGDLQVEHQGSPFSLKLIPDFSHNKHFYKIMGLLFLLNFGIYFASPVFPVYWVNQMHLTDKEISIGNSLFFITTFLGSTQLSRLGRFKYKNVIGVGGMLMAYYPVILSLGTGSMLFYLASLGGGLASSLVGGMLVNYVLEKVPESNRSSYLAIYNISLYSAVLLGSLTGPFISSLIGPLSALLLFAFIRMVAGLAVLLQG